MHIISTRRLNFLLSITLGKVPAYLWVAVLNGSTRLPYGVIWEKHFRELLSIYLSTTCIVCRYLERNWNKQIDFQRVICDKLVSNCILFCVTRHAVSCCTGIASELAHLTMGWTFIIIYPLYYYVGCQKTWPVKHLRVSPYTQHIYPPPYTPR